jgi:DNA replication protein DnaC
MINQTLEKLTQMRMTVMVNEYRRQAELPSNRELSFEERMSMMVVAEWTERQNRRLKRLLRQTELRCPEACVENIDYDPHRKLDRVQIASLCALSWIRERTNLFITGKTGTGKSWIASAFGNAACRKGISVKTVRVNRLLEGLCASRSDGTWIKLLNGLKKPELLIMDDFALSTFDALQCRDMLEIVEDRCGKGSILMTAQMPVGDWHSLFEDATLADATLDRLVHNAHRIELHGPSRRTKQQAAVMDDLPAHEEL